MKLNIDELSGFVALGYKSARTGLSMNHTSFKSKIFWVFCLCIPIFQFARLLSLIDYPSKIFSDNCMCGIKAWQNSPDSKVFSDSNSGFKISGDLTKPESFYFGFVHLYVNGEINRY